MKLFEKEHYPTFITDYLAIKKSWVKKANRTYGQQLLSLYLVGTAQLASSEK